jgi:hypothetical protein
LYQTLSATITYANANKCYNGKWNPLRRKGKSETGNIAWNERIIKPTGKLCLICYGYNQQPIPGTASMVSIS